MPMPYRMLAFLALPAAAVAAVLWLGNLSTPVAATPAEAGPIRTEPDAASLDNRLRHMSEDITALSEQVQAVKAELAVQKQRSRRELESLLRQLARDSVQVRSFGFNLCPQGFIGKRKSDRKLGPGEHELLYSGEQLRKLLKDDRFHRISAAWLMIRRENESAVVTQPSAGWAPRLTVIESNREAIKIDVFNMPRDEFVAFDVYVAYYRKPAEKK